jgi:hypothetical protein
MARITIRKTLEELRDQLGAIAGIKTAVISSATSVESIMAKVSTVQDFPAAIVLVNQFSRSEGEALGSERQPLVILVGDFSAEAEDLSVLDILEAIYRKFNPQVIDGEIGFPTLPSGPSVIVAGAAALSLKEGDRSAYLIQFEIFEDGF